MPRPLCCASPWVDTSTRSGSFGLTMILLILTVSSRPMCVHVLPASIDLYMPSPSEPCTESPVPAYTMFVAPSDTNIVYAGTGDSVQGSLGDGMYKSIDAGKTWTHIGLEDTVKTNKIVVDPKEPNLL